MQPNVKGRLREMMLPRTALPTFCDKQDIAPTESDAVFATVHGFASRRDVQPRASALLVAEIDPLCCLLCAPTSYPRVSLFSCMKWCLDIAASSVTNKLHWSAMCPVLLPGCVSIVLTWLPHLVSFPSAAVMCKTWVGDSNIFYPFLGIWFNQSSSFHLGVDHWQLLIFQRETLQ